MAHEYRLARWSDLAKERAELGMSIRKFCAMKGFAENTYFYWQRKLRNAACTQLEAEGVSMPVADFAEVALVPSSESPGEAQAGQLQAQIKGIHLSVDSSYPPEKLAVLLRELCGSC